MSTSTKRPLQQALDDEMKVRAKLFDTYERWVVAGSVRRKKPRIGDVEHVVIPLDVSKFWQRIDELTFTGAMFEDESAPFRKHVYPNGQNRWGQLYRGVDFNGFAHEIFLADTQNFGSVLAIRTGPADFSQMLVTKMLEGKRLRQQGGYVWYVNSGEIYPVPTEEAFFEACRVPFVAPEARLF